MVLLLRVAGSGRAAPAAASLPAAGGSASTSPAVGRSPSGSAAAAASSTRSGIRPTHSPAHTANTNHRPRASSGSSAGVAAQPRRLAPHRRRPANASTSQRWGRRIAQRRAPGQRPTAGHTEARAGRVPNTTGRAGRATPRRRRCGARRLPNGAPQPVQKRASARLRASH